MASYSNKTEGVEAKKRKRGDRLLLGEEEGATCLRPLQVDVRHKEKGRRSQTMQRNGHVREKGS